jgi:ABC-2 type transport system permease protein
MQAMFYATPIIYPLSLVSDKWPGIAKLLLLNPVAQAIQDVRYLAVTPVTQTTNTVTNHVWFVAAPFFIVIVCAVGAVIFFKKRSPSFAEDV